MKKLALKQNTPEWEEFRRMHIGASDAPTICGVNPFKTIYSLWKEKATGESGRVTPYMKRGLELEDLARSYAEDKLDIEFNPLCGLHSNIKYMMASFDGYNEDLKCILEIKCPGERVYEEVRKGEIPKSYIYQINHQLEVSGFDRGFLYVFNGKEGIPFLINKDPVVVNEILEKENDFWLRIINFDPPEDTHVIREDEEWNEIANNFLSTKKELERVEDRLKQLRQLLIEKCASVSTKGCGVTVTKYMTKGTVDYNKIPELKSIDLNPYRRPSKEAWRVA